MQAIAKLEARTGKRISPRTPARPERCDQERRELAEVSLEVRRLPTPGSSAPRQNALA